MTGSSRERHMEHNDIIYRNILNNMSDGVMTIDLNGQIVTFNNAADKTLGIKAEEVLNRPFAEAFLLLEGNDDFNQTVLDAVYESESIHNRVVGFNNGGRDITLEVTTSFLQEDLDGKRTKVAVIVVFKDITEVNKLRDAERQLTGKLKENHKELQDAYMKIEESNQSLETALKKVQMLRIGASAFAIVLFVGLGLYSWNSKGALADGGGHVSAPAGPSSQVQTVTITPRHVSSSLLLTGELMPLQVINITSPFDGKVSEKMFQYGESVKKGRLLVRMNTYEVESQYRDAKVSYIRAAEALRELENWKDSTEVSNAKRTRSRAKMTLDKQQQTLSEVKSLFDKGIVPSSEYDNAKQQLINAEMDHTSAIEALDTALSKGREDNLNIARMELENAKLKLGLLENQRERAEVRAPVSGTVILPDTTGGNKGQSKFIEKGSSISLGEVLISIGDMEGLSVRTTVDEIGVLRIKKGQRVMVTGDAFPGTMLNGTVSHISSQAISGGRMGSPSFEVIVSIPKLTGEQKDKVLLGMSSSLEFIIYEKPDAMLVPISAVRFEGADRFVSVRDKASGGFRDVKVQTGPTTLDSVEITNGVSPGDEVRISF